MDGEREQGDMKTAATSHDCGMEQGVTECEVKLL